MKAVPIKQRMLEGANTPGVGLLVMVQPKSEVSLVCVCVVLGDASVCVCAGKEVVRFIVC